MSYPNDLYAVHKHPWGTTPEPEVARYAPALKPGTILDIGVGDGRNALFLVRHGFKLVGLDIASEAIDILLNKAEEAGVQDNVTGIVADISEYKLVEPYDNILSHFTLHFIAQEKFLPVLHMMQAQTSPGGIHFISDFTQEGPLYKPTTSKYWLKKDELKQLYSDWEVIHYEEKPVKTRATDEAGNRYMHTAALLVARKPEIASKRN